MELPYTSSKDTLVHPIEVMQTQGEAAEFKQKLHQMRSVYGFALPARVCIEQEMLARTKRMGGLESSNLLLQSYNNTLTDIDAKDLYGLPRNQPEVQPAPRAVFEKQFFGEELISTQRKSTMMKRAD